MSLHLHIQANGGLLNQSDIGRAWGLSRSRVHDLVHLPGFPDPVTTVGGRSVWAGVDVAQWREARGQMSGRRLGK